MRNVVVYVQKGEIKLAPQMTLQDLRMCDFACEVRGLKFHVLKDRHGKNSQTISLDEAFSRAFDHVEMATSRTLTPTQYWKKWNKKQNEKED